MALQVLAPDLQLETMGDQRRISNFMPLLIALQAVGLGKPNTPENITGRALRVFEGEEERLRGHWTLTGFFGCIGAVQTVPDILPE